MNKRKVSHLKSVYCAFCRSPHRVYRQKSVGWIQALLSLITAVVLSLVLFHELNPQLLLFFVVGLVVAEVVSQVRWRLSLVCRQCGFDPVTYRKDSALAVTKVREHLARRNSSSMLLTSGPLQLPTLTPERAALLRKVEGETPQLSKHI